MGISSGRFAATPIPNEEHCPVPNELIGRLYRAAASSVHEIVATLAPAQQAELAWFCYGRAHLREVGLSIAARCDRTMLIAAARSTAAGEVIYAQSRDTARAPEGPGRGRRPSITLASKTSNSALAKLIAAMADDEPATNDNLGSLEPEVVRAS